MIRLVTSFALILAAAAPLPAQELDAQVAAEMDAALAGGLDAAEAEALYRAAVLVHGDVSELLSATRARLDEEPQVETARALRWLELHLLRRRGQLTAAASAAQRLVELDEEDAAAHFAYGRLLDANGRRDDARDSYARALELLPSGDPREVDLRLRLALLTMESGEEESQTALADFAKGDGSDAEMSNRAAVVLALLGRPKDAIELFEVSGEGSKRFRQEIRIAEWALEAGETTVAQDWGWIALESATMDRDRWYALTVVVEAHRVDESLDRLISRFAEAEQLDGPSRQTWIALLRETERYDEAIALFHGNADGGDFASEMRRELLEMYRESGREEEMIEQYRQLMDSEPENWVWPEGLARYYLERGDTDAARALWLDFVENNEPGLSLIGGAEALSGLGQDDLAIRCAERCIEDGRGRYAAFLFLFDLHRFRGELVAAEEALDRMHDAAPEDAPERMQLAESYERIGNLRRAVEVLEQLRSARGAAETGEDLEMRLAWLHSEIGDEEIALERWRELWLRVNSVPRRRYVEDRMMTVAARLGVLADIAIDLERKLYAGSADDRDSGLLVRLYTKVGDPVSATEIIEEHLKFSGGSQLDAMQEKARVFLACTDYHNYELTVRELIAIDPEGEADYLRQIAMSMLERGKPEQARAILTRLKELGSESDSFEFEAGVLALAGMRPEAIIAYRRGVAEVPDRIESYLLMADLMRATGQQDRAIGMFQHLAETAEKDDLFTIAIDGLLNMEAPPPVMQWARRITLERLARRHDKVYLYQLLADLGEEIADMDARYAALEGQLPIAGDRRSSVVRELMDLAAGSTSFFGRMTPSDPERHLAYGRRLIGLGQLVPPQVYLDLGRVFLDSGDVANASKTFRLARDLPDFDQFQRDTAQLFEEARYLNEALATYKKVLIGDAGNAGLLVKVGELEEQLGDDAAATRLYVRTVELLLARRPLVSGKEDEEGDAFSRWFARNVDDFDRFYERALKGVLVALDDVQASELVDRHAGLLRDELDETLRMQDTEVLPMSRYPRLSRRAEFLRRVAFGFGIVDPVERLDRELLAAFPDDPGLLEQLVRERVRWGMTEPARRMLADSGRPDDELRKLRFLVGEGVEESASSLVPVDEAMRLILPLLTDGRADDAKALLRRIDFSTSGEEPASGIPAVLSDATSGDAGALLSAAIYLEDPDLCLYLGRNWLRMLLSGEQPAMSYQVQPVLDRCTIALEGEHLRSLYQYYVQLILEDPEKRGEHLRLIPDLQERLEEPLLDSEQLTELIAENGARLYFNMGPLLRMAPPEERAGLASQVWAEVAPTMRRYFLFNLVEQMEEPLGEDLEALILEWFGDELNEMSLEDYAYQLDGLCQDQVLDYAGDLCLEMLTLVEKKEPGDALAPALRARALWNLDRREEALPLALDAYFDEQLRDATDYYYSNARRQIEFDIFPEMPEPFLVRMDEIAEELGGEPDLEATNQRLQLIRRLNDPELQLAETRLAVERHPDELPLQQQLRGALLSAGLRTEADALFLAMVEAHPEDIGLAQQAFRMWDGRRHSVRAADALDHWQALVAEQGEEGGELAGATILGGSGGQIVQVSSSTGSMAMLLTPGGQLVQISGSDDEDDGRVQPATVPRLKEFVDEESWDDARNQLRRLWRSYPSNDRNPFGIVYFSSSMMGGRGGGMAWPQDEEEAEEPTEEEQADQEAEAARRRRGGMASYREEVEERPEPLDGYEVLSAYPFAVDEMRRRLRTNGPAGLRAMAPVINGLAEARVREVGAEQAIQELLDAASSGVARKVDLLQLLALLESHPEAVGTSAQEVLDDLERSLHPRDGTQLLRLARVMAATGARERAIDIYRWCATQTTASRYFSMRQGEYGSIPLRQLVEEVKEVLVDGDDMLPVIEDVLRYSSPVEYPWEREQHQMLMLDTWIELLDAASALERCAEIVESADSPDEPIRRQVADKAAWLYAHEAQFDRAIACLEVAICEFPAGAFASDRWYRQRIFPMRSFNITQFRRFLPSDVEGWKDPAGWALLLGDRLLDWAEAERVRTSDALRGAALAAIRAHENGDTAGAQALLARAAELLEDDASSGLWVADAARQIGLPELADGIERAQLDSRRLNVHRIHEVVRRALEAEGAEAALELGEGLSDYTLHPDLLGVVTEAAGTAGDPARSEAWSELVSSAETAQEKIEAWREEEKRKAEEAKEKTG